MARLQTDVSSVDADQRDFTPLPAGTYLAKIIESDLVDTKSGSGQILKLTFEIADGDYTGRKVWDQPNIVNANPTAQTIGQQRLKAICDAIGHSGNVDDSEELHEQPMLIRLAVEQKDANYAPKNVIKGVYAADMATPGNKPAANPSTARTTNNGGSSATRPVPGATGDKPWQRNRAAGAAR